MSVDVNRTKDLKRIHIYKRDLGLDDETYRAMLQSLTGKTTARDMDYKERYVVLKEMAKRLPPDKRPHPAKKQPLTYPGRPAKQGADREPLISKIEALLADAKRPWTYAHSMAMHMFGNLLVQWCNADQLWRIVAALEKDKRRREDRADAKAKEQAVVHD